MAGKRIVAGVLLGLIFMMMPVAPARSDEPVGYLLFFTQQYCSYCQRFEQEVGSGYHRTQAGRMFPLMKIDIHAPDGPFWDKAAYERFTPSFMVVDQTGRELARFRGYRTDEFFWAEMEAFMQRVQVVHTSQR